jgi:Tfp pilus assembly protein PilF
MRRFSSLALGALLAVAMAGIAFAEDAAPAASSTPSTGTPELYAGASEACRSALVKASALILRGQWKSAYQVLVDFDPAGDDPYALAMRIDLVLNGAVRSDLHTAFGLVDLAEGQDLESLRNSEGAYDRLEFDPPAVAVAQASKGIAAPPVLSKELGDYYHDVLARYAGQWTIPDAEIASRAADQYGAAYSAGLFDLSSLERQADALDRASRGAEAEAIYHKALELEPGSARLHYNFGVSLLARGMRPESLPEFDKAIELYGTDDQKANAMALAARAATELGDDARAESYFAKVEAAYPDTPTPLVLRHMVAVECDKSAAADAAADALVPEWGSNPNVVRTLVSTWYAAGKPADARAFLERNLSKSRDDMTIGTLDFYYAVLLVQAKSSDADRALALKALDEAEARFKVVLGDESDVYSSIAQIRSALQAPAASGAEGAK